MLIRISDTRVINIQRINELFIKKISKTKTYGIRCYMTIGECVIKEYTTKEEAIEALDKILSQYDRGQRVIKL